MTRIHQIKTKVTKEGLIIVAYGRAARGRKKVVGQRVLKGGRKPAPADVQAALEDLGIPKPKSK
jgi:hypothetical protein